MNNYASSKGPYVSTKKPLKKRTLRDLYKGMTFADAAKEIEKKYPDRHINAMQRNGFTYEMDALSKLNDEARMREQLTQSQGDPYSQATPGEVPQMQAGGQLEVTPAPTPDESKEWLRQWYTNPETIERIGNSNVADQTVSSINDTRLNIHPNDLDFQQQYKKHTGYYARGRNPGFNYHGKVHISEPRVYGSDNWTMDDVVTHETVHSTPLQYHYSTEKINQNFGTNFSMGDQELYPRIMELRKRMGVQPGEQITQEHLDSQRDIIDNRLHGATDEQLMNILNVIADNSSRGEDNRAAYGGDMKYQGGGTLPTLATKPLIPITPLGSKPSPAGIFSPTPVGPLPVPPPKDTAGSRKNLLSGPYGPAIIGEGISLLGDSITAFSSKEEESPIHNPNEQQALRRLESTTLPSDSVYKRATRAYNTGRANLDNVRSAGLKNALEQNLHSNFMDSMSEIAMQDKQRMNQTQMNLSQAELQLGDQRAAEDRRTRDSNFQHHANSRFLRSQVLNRAADNAKFFTREGLNDKMNQMYSKIINAKYTDFGVNEDLYNKVINGEDLTNVELLTLKNSKKGSDLSTFYSFMKGK